MRNYLLAMVTTAISLTAMFILDPPVLRAQDCENLGTVDGSTLRHAATIDGFLTDYDCHADPVKVSVEREDGSIWNGSCSAVNLDVYGMSSSHRSKLDICRNWNNQYGNRRVHVVNCEARNARTGWFDVMAITFVGTTRKPEAGSNSEPAKRNGDGGASPQAVVRADAHPVHGATPSPARLNCDIPPQAFEHYYDGPADCDVDPPQEILDAESLPQEVRDIILSSREFRCLTHVFRPLKKSFYSNNKGEIHIQANGVSKLVCLPFDPRVALSVNIICYSGAIDGSWRFALIGEYVDSEGKVRETRLKNVAMDPATPTHWAHSAFGTDEFGDADRVYLRIEHFSQLPTAVTPYVIVHAK